MNPFSLIVLHWRTWRRQIQVDGRTALQRALCWSVSPSLPEAILTVGRVGISLSQKQFQRLTVRARWGLEDALTQAFESDEGRLILCHRGSLDPLAYWLSRSWEMDEFFPFARTRREEHYQRYAAKIHLVTAADGAAHAHKSHPEAHRPDPAQESVRPDRGLPFLETQK